MFDVMLIDDDFPVRGYLREVISWEKLQLRLVCEAGDSETARELYHLYRPDIVITDISIPIVSGLDLAKEFIRENADLRIIVITGFGDFKNVRESVAPSSFCQNPSFRRKSTRAWKRRCSLCSKWPDATTQKRQ